MTTCDANLYTDNAAHHTFSRMEHIAEGWHHKPSTCSILCLLLCMLRTMNAVLIMFMAPFIMPMTLHCIPTQGQCVIFCLFLEHSLSSVKRLS